MLGSASPERNALLGEESWNISPSGLVVAMFSVSVGPRLVRMVVSPLRVENLMVQGEPALGRNTCRNVKMKLLVATVQLVGLFPEVAQARLLPKQNAQASWLVDILYCLYNLGVRSLLGAWWMRLSQRPL